MVLRPHEGCRDDEGSRSRSRSSTDDRACATRGSRAPAARYAGRGRERRIQAISGRGHANEDLVGVGVGNGGRSVGSRHLEGRSGATCPDSSGMSSRPPSRGGQWPIRSWARSCEQLTHPGGRDGRPRPQGQRALPACSRRRTRRGVSRTGTPHRLVRQEAGADLQPRRVRRSS